MSAKADDFRVWENATASLYGTSAASPTFGSVIALVNDRLAQKGKNPLGFLNPWLYSKGVEALTDITSGKSDIECNGEHVGFEAVAGWDPVSWCKADCVVGLVEVLTVDWFTRCLASGRPTSTSFCRCLASEVPWTMPPRGCVVRLCTYPS